MQLPDYSRTPVIMGLLSGGCKLNLEFNQGREAATKWFSIDVSTVIPRSCSEIQQFYRGMPLSYSLAILMT